MAIVVIKYLISVKDWLEVLSPNGNLIQASNGRIYGMTAYGGFLDEGTQSIPSSKF